MLAQAQTSHEWFDKSSSGKPLTADRSPLMPIWLTRRCKKLRELERWPIWG
jgi:hypothetical protein